MIIKGFGLTAEAFLLRLCNNMEQLANINEMGAISKSERDLLLLPEEKTETNFFDKLLSFLERIGRREEKA